MNSSSFEDNKALFGSDSTERIVAVELVDDAGIRVFTRLEDRISWTDEPFTSFLLLEDEKLLDGFKTAHRIEPLSSSNSYRAIALFGRWNDCRKGRDYLARGAGKSASSPQAPYLFISDPVHQHLLLTGKTLFKGMAYDDIHRLALDIETECSPGYEFPNAARPEDRIVSIALMDNRGHSEVLFGGDMSEKEMIEALGERISRRDPDVIEGHNIFNFDLEYIFARAKMHGIRLRWGRDGGFPKARRSRFTVAERIIDFTRTDIFGRHIVDTMFMLQYYDIAARELESYGLKAAVQHFGLADEDRTYIDPRMIRSIFKNKPETLKKYNLDDVKETLALSERLGYPFFLQTRIFPFSYQNIFVRGNATKINALLMREYIAKRASIPKPVGKGTFEGGYTDVFVQGVVRNIVHCDATSLYPSIALAYNLKPSGDTLDVFLPLLRDLRTFRLEAKKRAKESVSSAERDYYEALQQTFKILINSFYGYLGTEIHNFSDPSVAAEVTRIGREILQRMIDLLAEEGAAPIEVDTDGIYFVPPHGTDTEEKAKALVERVSKSLPAGIEVEMDGMYAAMFSYKRKNYALLDMKGNTIVKGSGLRSRGMEKYLREFLSAMLRFLLEGRGEEAYRLCREYCDRLARHDFDIALLARTETLGESSESYLEKVKAKKRNRGAPQELALASGREHRAGDQISYYVTGSGKRVRIYENCKPASAYDPEHPDENIEYYRAKLIELFGKFEEFLPPGPSRTDA